MREGRKVRERMDVGETVKGMLTMVRRLIEAVVRNRIG